MPPMRTDAEPPPLTIKQPRAQNGMHADKELVRTKILLMGMRTSGKSSIREVLFNGMAAKETFYLERTTKITKHAYDSVIPLEIWDCPGDTELAALNTPLSHFSTLIFVIDIQGLLQQPVAKLVQLVEAAYKENSELNLEVFVHKADVLSEDYKLDTFANIQQRILDEIYDVTGTYEEIPINFHLTSIYDYSLQDEFSRALQKSIESLPYLEDLLNVFCANSQSSKAFLFDIRSRLYVATDASPVDRRHHDLCLDYLDMLMSFGPLYRSVSASPARHRLPSPPSTHQSPLTSEHSSPAHAPALLHSNGTSRSPSPPLSPPASSLSTSSHSHPHPQAQPSKAKDLFYPSASTSLSPSPSGAGTTLTYHLVTAAPPLALLALVPTAVWSARRGLVEYNAVFLREGVQEICAVEGEVRGA